MHYSIESELFVGGPGSWCMNVGQRTAPCNPGMQLGPRNPGTAASSLRTHLQQVSVALYDFETR